MLGLRHVVAKLITQKGAQNGQRDSMAMKSRTTETYTTNHNQ